MSTFTTRRVAVAFCVSIFAHGVVPAFATGCAAEHLEARDATRGPAAADSPTVPVSRPSALSAPEAPTEPAPKSPDDALPYACPMHPEQRAAQPGKTCSLCGMKLVRKPAP